MLQRKKSDDSAGDDGVRVGCGPLIPSLGVSTRPLRQQIFEHIRAAGLCARIDVANNLNVSPASVTAITTDLLDAGYLEEITSTVRDGEPARGRPPVSIGVRAETFYVCGIYLGDVRNTAIIVDFGGNVIGSASIDHNIAQRSPEALIDDASKVLAHALVDANLEKEALTGIGLGMPGLIDTHSGMVVWSPLLDRRGVNLRKLAFDRFDIHVDIDNDANIVTLAELWFGKARAMSNFVVVTIEHGIGMGIVINHKLYRGGLGLGMEFGHTKVQLDGALCR
ncbi:MAG: ROK family protein, partial [Pseudomonadota bacterium]